MALLRPQKGKKFISRVLRHLDKSQQLELLLLVVNSFSRFDVVANAAILDDPMATPNRGEVERQTDVFLNGVLASFFPLIQNLSFVPIIHIVTLLCKSPNLPQIAKSQVS